MSALVLLPGDHTHMASAHMVFDGWDAFLLSLAGGAVGRAWFPSWLSIRIPIWGSPPLQLPINTSAVTNARLEAEGAQTKPASQLPGIGNNPTSRDSEAHSLPEETSGSSREWERGRKSPEACGQCCLLRPRTTIPLFQPLGPSGEVLAWEDQTWLAACPISEAESC